MVKPITTQLYFKYLSLQFPNYAPFLYFDQTIEDTAAYKQSKQQLAELFLFSVRIFCQGEYLEKNLSFFLNLIKALIKLVPTHLPFNWLCPQFSQPFRPSFLRFRLIRFSSWITVLKSKSEDGKRNAISRSMYCELIGKGSSNRVENITIQW